MFSILMRGGGRKKERERNGWYKQTKTHNDNKLYSHKGKVIRSILTGEGRGQFGAELSS